MLLLALLKEWKFWVLWLDWRICAINWKQMVHVFYKTKHFGVNNEWWSEQPSFFAQPLLKTLLVHLLSYRQCALLLYSPLAGARFRLQSLAGYTFSTPDSLKYDDQTCKKFVWVGRWQKKLIAALGKFGVTYKRADYGEK